MFTEEIIDFPVPRDRLRSTGLRIAVPIMVPTMPLRADNRIPPACGSNPFASSKCQLSYSTDTGNFAACQVPVQIPKIIFQFRQSCTLGQVVREFLKISKPKLSVLPMDKTSAAHKNYYMADCCEITSERKCRRRVLERPCSFMCRRRSYLPVSASRILASARTCSSASHCGSTVAPFATSRAATPWWLPWHPGELFVHPWIAHPRGDE